MAALEPGEICDTIPGGHSATIVALNTDMQSFTASLKNAVEDAIVKPVFESVHALLALVRVGLSARSVPLYPLIVCRTRISR